MKKILIFFGACIVAILGFFFLVRESTYDECGGEYCPRCNSKNVGTFLYGLSRPEREDSITMEKVEKGLIIPRGCCISYDSHKYICHDCGLEWGIFFKESND